MKSKTNKQRDLPRHEPGSKLVGGILPLFSASASYLELLPWILLMMTINCKLLLIFPGCFWSWCSLTATKKQADTSMWMRIEAKRGFCLRNLVSTGHFQSHYTHCGLSCSLLCCREQQFVGRNESIPLICNPQFFFSFPFTGQDLPCYCTGGLQVRDLKGLE